MIYHMLCCVLFIAGRQQIKDILKKVFGFESFRQGQIETVERILRGVYLFLLCKHIETIHRAIEYVD